MKKKNARVAPGKKRTRRIRKPSQMFPHTPEPLPLLDDVTIAAIASDEAGNMSDTGSPGSFVHNVKTIGAAIRRALESIPNGRLAR